MYNYSFGFLPKGDRKREEEKERAVLPLRAVDSIARQSCHADRHAAVHCMISLSVIARRQLVCIYTHVYVCECTYILGGMFVFIIYLPTKDNRRSFLGRPQVCHFSLSSIRAKTTITPTVGSDRFFILNSDLQLYFES